jgi:MFS family permease
LRDLINISSNQVAASGGGGVQPRHLLKSFFITSLGGMLEFYDFVIFVFLTQAIGQSFFPTETPDWLKQAQVFALFAAGYLARPLGGIIMAHFGDLKGRKRVFMLSVLMMAVPTFAIGLLPSYSSIGYAAPLLLLVCRMLQGAAVGGEVPGAWVFVSEHASASRTGMACGMLTAGLTAGIFLGAAVNMGLTLIFNQAAISSWAWRLPFMLGGLLGLVGMALRSKLFETPVFEALKREAGLSGELPLKRALRDHPKAVVVSMLATWFLTAVIVVLILLAPTLLRQAANADPSLIAVAGLAETAALPVGCWFWGVAIDRIGVQSVTWIAIVAVPVAAYALFGLNVDGASMIAVFAAVGLTSGLIVFVPVVLVRAFPSALAFSGVSTSYNASYAVAGGVTPPLVGYLFHLDRTAPAAYVIFVCLLCGITVIWWLKTKAQISQ